MQIKRKLNKGSIDLYVFEDARLNGATPKHVGQLVQPEINMADENPRKSWTSF